MIHTSEVNFLPRIRGALGAHLLFGGVATTSNPRLLIIPYIALITWAIIRYLQCAHITERFTDYATYLIIGIFSLSCFSIFLSITAAMHLQSNIPVNDAMLISSVALVPHLALYYWIYNRKTFVSPFTHDNTRVKTISLDNSPSPQHRRYLIGIGTGAGSLIAPNLIQYEWSAVVIIAILYISVSAVAYHYRNAISGVRLLKSQETKAGRHFLFENLEVIRKSRESSWTSRSIQKIFNQTF